MSETTSLTRCLLREKGRSRRSVTNEIRETWLFKDSVLGHLGKEAVGRESGRGRLRGSTEQRGGSLWGAGPSYFPAGEQPPATSSSKFFFYPLHCNDLLVVTPSPRSASSFQLKGLHAEGILMAPGWPGCPCGHVLASPYVSCTATFVSFLRRLFDEL